MRRLIIRPGAIGDCLLALPALEYLQSGYTEVWAPGAVLPLLQFADTTRSIASTHLDLLGLPGVQPPQTLLATLKTFDSIVSWYGSNQPDFCRALAQIHEHVQFFPALPPAPQTQHCADFFALQVGAPLPAIPRLALPPRRPTDHAVIHPFSGSQRKNWPLDRYRELADQLSLPVRWCAGPEEQLPQATRFDNLLELANWLSTARVYIGNDSGITHLAAAAGIPVVAIFGPTDPAVWAPRGTNIRVIHGKLEEISVSEVHDAIASLL